MDNPNYPGLNVGGNVFQANPNAIQAMQQSKENAMAACKKCMNARVQVHTVHGHVFEGDVLDVDNDHLYLRLTPFDGRGFFPFAFGGSNTILTLSLFTLLAIALI